MKNLIARMRKRCGRAPERQSGQGLAEYALILALIAAICIAAVGTLGTAIANSPGFSLI
jgi:Flp pilus assembly pilin Flp